MSKISLPQKNIQINGGKRFVFTMSAIIAAISSAVAYGASLVTFSNVVTAIGLASLAYEVGKEITKETTPDELEKGWVIIKPKIRQSKINSRSVAGPMRQMNRRPSV